MRRRLAYEADPAAFAATLRRRRGGAARADRRRAGAAAVGACCPTPRCAGSPRSARRSRSTACAPTWSSPGRRWRWPPGRGATDVDDRGRARGRAAGAAAPAPPRPVRRAGPGRGGARRGAGRRGRGARRPIPTARDPDGPGRRRAGARRRTVPHAPDGANAASGESDCPTPASRWVAGRRRARPATAPSAGRAARRRRRSGARRLEVPGVGEGAPGRRSRARTEQRADVRRRRTARRGAPPSCTCPRPSRPPPRTSGARGRAGAGLVVRRDDLREAEREGREGNLVLFVVDASGSMAARQRMSAVKGAVLSLLLDAYQRRDKVGLVTFRGTGAELVLPPTSSRRRAARPGSQRCPRAGARRWPPGCCGRGGCCGSSGCATPAGAPLLVVRDRRPGHGAARPGTTRSRDACRAAGLLAADGIATVVVDCEAGPVRLGLAARLAGGRGGAAGRPRRPVAPTASPASCKRRAHAALEEDRLMPQGQPVAVPDDGLTTRQRRNRPLLVVHTGEMKGKSTAAFGLALRGVEPGLADRGVPVREVGEVAGRRGDGAPRARCPARAPARAGPSTGTRWARAGRGPASRAPTTTTRRRRGRAGSRSSADLDGETYELYVLDEFTYPMKWGWVDVDEVVDVLARPAGHPARRHHRPRRRAGAGRGRRPGHRDDQGQAPDGRRAEGPAGHRVVSVPRSGRRRAGLGQREDHRRDRA